MFLSLYLSPLSCVLFCIRVSPISKRKKEYHSPKANTDVNEYLFVTVDLWQTCISMQRKELSISMLFEGHDNEMYPEKETKETASIKKEI